MIQFSFHRPILATQLCEALSGVGLIDAKSGMFLAAPRRVGKSTFLREDLVPEIHKRGWFPVYIDLWSDKKADPAVLISEAIKSALASLDGIVTKTAKSVGLDKLNLGGFNLDMNKIGLPDNITVSKALEKLNEISNKPIVLIIDEAQHALKTSDGLSLMFALKAARDHLNRTNEKPRLMLVFTGSHRDKLAHLVLKKNQPFFGASITAFPLLGIDFVTAFTNWANENLPQGNQLSSDAVLEAFKLVGHRPEMLRNVIGQVALAGEAGNLSAILKDKAIEFHEQIWDEMESDFEALNELQKAILQVMISKNGKQYQPFSEESMTGYRTITGDMSISITSVQSTLDTLRDKELIWNPSRGYYALEDEGFAEWYRRRKLA